jgi:hypothetical protein
MSENNTQPTCAELVNTKYASRMEDLIEVFNTEEFNDYGLCFDFVEASAPDFEPYYRYQLSWGGPSDEIRFYEDRATYHYMDWFDGASVPADDDIIEDIKQYFIDVGMLEVEKLCPVECEDCGEYIEEGARYCDDCASRHAIFSLEVDDMEGTKEELVDYLEDLIDDIKGKSDIDDECFCYGCFSYAEISFNGEFQEA